MTPENGTAFTGSDDTGGGVAATVGAGDGVTGAAGVTAEVGAGVGAGVGVGVGVALTVAVCVGEGVFLSLSCPYA